MVRYIYSGIGCFLSQLTNMGTSSAIVPGIAMSVTACGIFPSALLAVAILPPFQRSQLENCLNRDSEHSPPNNSARLGLLDLLDCDVPPPDEALPDRRVGVRDGDRDDLEAPRNFWGGWIRGWE